MFKVVFISRDARVHNLFRKNWVSAFELLNYEVVPIFRNELFHLNFIKCVFLAKVYAHKIVLFGVAEALLFGIVRPDLVVLTGLGRLLLRDNRKRKFVFKLLKIYYSKTDIIVLNKSDYRIFKALRFARVAQISGEGVDLERYQNRFNHNKYEHTRSVTTFCYIGRFIKSKNVHLLIKYFDEVLRYDDGIRVILVGDTDFSSSDALEEGLLENFRDRHKGKVYLQGFVSNVENVLETVDVFINLSKREGLPFSVIEALASGCKCILSNVPGNQEFKHYDEVILVKNEHEFISAVNYFSKIKINRSTPNLKRFSSRNVEREIVNYVQNHF